MSQSNKSLANRREHVLKRAGKAGSGLALVRELVLLVEHSKDPVQINSCKHEGQLL